MEDIKLVNLKNTTICGVCKFGLVEGLFMNECDETAFEDNEGYVVTDKNGITHCVMVLHQHYDYEEYATLNYGIEIPEKYIYDIKPGNVIYKVDVYHEENGSRTLHCFSTKEEATVFSNKTNNASNPIEFLKFKDDTPDKIIWL